MILADEPTGNLDSTLDRRRPRTCSQDLHDEGRTIVLITHEPTSRSAPNARSSIHDGQIWSPHDRADGVTAGAPA